MNANTLPNYSDLIETYKYDPPPPVEHDWENKSTLTKHRDTYPFIDPFRFQGKLTGKVVIVTLAHRGIGRATALAFAQAGASVCCIGPSAQSLEPILREIKEKFNKPALALTADLLQPNAPKEVIALVEKHLGPVDILVNIGPAPYLRPFSSEPDIMQDWWPSMERHLRVPIAMIHAVLPSMLSRQAGIVISTTPLPGIIHLPWVSGPGVASAALLKFHHHLDYENRSKGILSFAVSPGPIPSHIHDPDTLITLSPEELSKDPEVQAKFVQIAGEMEWASAGLVSGTFVTLCAEPRAEILSGLYINAERDLGEVISGCENNRGRLKEKRLYQLKIDEL